MTIPIWSRTKEATVSETLKQIMAERDLSRAITALYLEVDESIVNDIRSKVDAAFQPVRDERDRLREALQAMLKLIDAEVLVRNTANDHAVGWSTQALLIVQALQQAQAALTPAGGGKKQ